MSQGAGSVWKVPLAVSLDTESCTTSVSPMPRRSKRAGRVGRAAEIQGIDEEFYMGVAAQQQASSCSMLAEATKKASEGAGRAAAFRRPRDR